jgi:hypothetical protein
MIFADLTDTKYNFNIEFEVNDGEISYDFIAESTDLDDKYRTELTFKETRQLQANCLRILAALSLNYGEL